MQERSVHGRRRLERALRALQAALDESGAPWMVIGGIAVIAHGVRRMTTDVDAVVQGDSVSIRGLLRLLARHGIRPRMGGAVAFAEENLVLLLRHEETGVDLDVSFGWTAFEIEALGNRSKTRFGRIHAPMATPTDLLVFKAMAGRPTDVQDATTLLSLYPEMDIERARNETARLAALADAPELAEGLEDILKRAARKRRRAPARKKTSRGRK